MEEATPNPVKTIFVRYKLLFIIYGVAILFALWEVFGVPSENSQMMKGPKDHLMANVDEEGSYYDFQRTKFEGRPEADYLEGMSELRKYKAASEQINALRTEGKQAEATALIEGARGHLEKAREHFESAIERGVVSNEDLLGYHCYTLKLLNVPDEEYQVSLQRFRKNFPLMQLPVELQGQPGTQSPNPNMATRAYE
ncbi:MAG: hypothetical protein KDA65_04665 [Planctomycetaceae bacterium]|nr:hypothetical protein [Planctomycetaceae bacterium]